MGDQTNNQIPSQGQMSLISWLTALGGHVKVLAPGGSTLWPEIPYTPPPFNRKKARWCEGYTAQLLETEA